MPVDAASAGVDRSAPRSTCMRSRAGSTSCRLAVPRPGGGQGVASAESRQAGEIPSELPGHPGRDDDGGDPPVTRELCGQGVDQAAGVAQVLQHEPGQTGPVGGLDPAGDDAAALQLDDLRPHHDALAAYGDLLDATGHRAAPRPCPRAATPRVPSPIAAAEPVGQPAEHVGDRTLDGRAGLGPDHPTTLMSVPSSTNAGFSVHEYPDAWADDGLDLFSTLSRLLGAGAARMRSNRSGGRPQPVAPRWLTRCCGSIG